jgi:hypothetical protein
MAKNAVSPVEKGPSSGVGLDLGTMNVLAARNDLLDGVQVTRVRDAFLDLDLDAKRTLKLSKASYVEMGDRLVVVGDQALTMANLFKREVRRPLSQGLISAGELDAQEILGIIIQQVCGKPVIQGEHCFYSVPAAPLDIPNSDVVYHTEVFRKILASQGYTPHPTNEALAIIYSQCEPEGFSGLALSFGAGMVNVALAYQATATKELQFSVAKSGDWVDSQSARAVGKTGTQMCAIKEKGIDLKNPLNREQEAIGFYLATVIDNALELIAERFKMVANQVDLPEAIPLVVSGGTSMAKGFLDLFKERFAAIQKKGFPIPITEVRAAKDPLGAVAEGLLVLAQSED